MPNPKSGTVTLEVGKAVKEVKAGKIDFKIDKQGIIHVGIGKASFSAENIRDNAAEMINVVAKLKPASAKGAYFRSITISTTMSPGITVDTNSIAGI
jgi:large subunit ribosomal protein L1